MVGFSGWGTQPLQKCLYIFRGETSTTAIEGLFGLGNPTPTKLLVSIRLNQDFQD